MRYQLTGHMGTQSHTHAAAKRVGGESPQEPSLTRSLAEHFTHWAGISDAAAVPAITEFRNYLRVLKRLQLASEAGYPAKLDGRLAARRDSAVELLDPIIGAGLSARKGRCLRPDAIIPGHERQMTADYRAWETITLCLNLLGARSKGFSVCESCTLVFMPSRKARARYCPLCAKRPAAPVLGTRSNPWPQRPGEQAQVRVPTWEGQERRSWTVRTITLGDGPDSVFIGRPDKQGSAKERKRRGRARAAPSPLRADPVVP
jgi:hypothetical protein